MPFVKEFGDVFEEVAQSQRAAPVIQDPRHTAASCIDHQDGCISHQTPNFSKLDETQVFLREDRDGIIFRN